MITGLSIENFKGVRDPVQLEIKPITLLFGANSAGKSTVLQALSYLQGLGLWAPPDWVRGEEQASGPSFWDLVNDHDVARPIRIGVTVEAPPVDLVKTLGFHRRRVAHFATADRKGNAQGALFFDRLPGDDAVVTHVAVAISVKWSPEFERTFVEEYRVEINGDQVATLTYAPHGNGGATPGATPRQSASIPEGEMRLGSVNWSHPLLAVAESGTEPLAGDVPLTVAHGQGARLRSRAGLLNPFLVVGVGIVDAALLRDGFAPPSLALLEALLGFVNEVMFGALSSYKQLGPIRSIPPRDYLAERQPLRGDWNSGSAAWWRLLEAPEEYLREVGDELCRLGLGHSLRRLGDPQIVLEILSALRATKAGKTAQAGRIWAFEQEVRCMLANPSVARTVVLVDDATGLELHPIDVGTGLSQVVPVVVAAMGRGDAQDDELVAIQQPELHVHPAVQVELGDLFARETGRGGVRLLVETHSEHIVLRLLRRIRETHEGSLPKGAPSLTPDQLAVIYVEKGDHGVTLRSLRVDETGEFLDPWPRGFFEERHGEIF